MKIEENKINEPLLNAEEVVRASEQSVPHMLITNTEIENSYYYCDCGKDESWKKTQAIDIFLITVMVLMGAFIMVNGIYTVAT